MKTLQIALVLFGFCSAMIGCADDKNAAYARLAAAEMDLIPLKDAESVAQKQYARYETRGSVGDDMLQEAADAVYAAARVNVRACMEEMKGATIKVIRAYHSQLLALRSADKARILAADTSLNTLIEARTALQPKC